MPAPHHCTQRGIAVQCANSRRACPNGIASEGGFRERREGRSRGDSEARKRQAVSISSTGVFCERKCARCAGEEVEYVGSYSELTPKWRVDVVDAAPQLKRAM